MKVFCIYELSSSLSRQMSKNIVQAGQISHLAGTEHVLLICGRSELYDYSLNATASPPATFPVRPCGSNCSGHMSVQFDGGVLICGGGTGTHCHHLKWGAKSWSDYPSMLRSHERGSAAVVRNIVWMVGGTSVETDQFVDGQWVDGPQIPWVGFMSKLVTVSWDKVSSQCSNKLLKHLSCLFSGCALRWSEFSICRKRLAV